MKVTVHNGYWEYDTTYIDVIRVDEGRHTFKIVKSGGFFKEFDKGIYSYRVED